MLKLWKLTTATLLLLVRYASNFCFTGQFFKSYSRLGQAPAPKINFWESLEQDFTGQIPDAPINNVTALKTGLIMKLLDGLYFVT